MKIMIYVVLSAFLAGCVAEGQFVNPNSSNNCQGKGSVDAKIAYGDAFIDVSPKVNVKQDGEIVLKLFPEKKPGSGTDYENVEIELVGKTPADSWLNKKVKATDTDKNRFSICVKKQQPGAYDYKVIVPGVGVLDPRVIVIQD